jgi:hypothetical protein
VSRHLESLPEKFATRVIYHSPYRRLKARSDA